MIMERGFEVSTIYFRIGMLIIPKFNNFLPSCIFLTVSWKKTAFRI
jgi:hypothetical protein